MGEKAEARLTRNEIVEILEEIAILLELKGENPFKIRAYQNGARALESMEDDLSECVEAGTLGKVKGIGAAIADKIATLHSTGVLEYYETLKGSVPAGLLEMLDIPGLGGKRIRRLYEELGVDGIAALQEAATDGRIADLKGFGPKTAENILNGIRNRIAYSARHFWWTANLLAGPVVEGLRGLPEVEQAEAAGSLRRGRETVGDLDFIVASSNPGPVMDWFTRLEAVREVTAKGETKSSVRLEGGVQADLRVVPPAQFAFALHHFTGSKEHNVLMRQRALQRGWSLSEWGLKPEVPKGGRKAGAAPPDNIRSESELFEALGLTWIPPELREGMGEIEAAEKGAIPRLIEEGDIRGVLHNHTRASDGQNSLEEMAAAAEELGFAYLGIADHSKASFQANGLDEERLFRQVEAIRRLNASGISKCEILAGCEVDILTDGTLDFDSDILSRLDYVVVSVHSSFGMKEADMTRRIIRALEHPHTHILGHATGRLLLRREGYAVDIGKIIDAAVANRKVIELNAHPSRLDLDWRYWRQAAERGVMCTISPDAHSAEGLEYWKMGVRIARKGWLTRENVLNTRSLAEVREYFRC